jgi:hypothetical protein
MTLSVFEVPNGIRFGDSFIPHDFQSSYVLKLKEWPLRAPPQAQIFDAFNVSNLVGSAGLPSSPFTRTLISIAPDVDGRPIASSAWARITASLLQAACTYLPGLTVRGSLPAFVQCGSQSQPKD